MYYHSSHKNFEDYNKYSKYIAYVDLKIKQRYAVCYLNNKSGLVSALLNMTYAFDAMIAQLVVWS